MEDSEENDNDTYIAQLKEVFDSCDTSGRGLLGEGELRDLCEKLHLLDHTEILITHLLENKHEVKFDDFKEYFIALLTQSIPTGEIEQENQSIEDVTDREVSPKFTLGRKKYGRRSRPESTADDDDDSPMESPALSPQSSVDQSTVFETSTKQEGKRPMSPISISHQPPTKSGRMTHESPCSHQSSSEADVCQSFDTNPVQYLQETWKKLNIGQNGFLNVEELALVCEHIGMDMTEEVVAQLFEKLDCDQDGQISFDEFLQGLFQHGDCDVVKPEASKTIYNDDHQISNSYVSGLFSSIDLNNTGYADPSAILELWESLETPCSPQILKDLGFNHNVKINLADLSNVLEEVLCNALNRPILQLAFVSFQNELHFLRQTIDQMHTERDRLRMNIEEANSRAALLAQEVDDNHAKLESSLHNKLMLMEKKYQDQTREQVAELQQERENLNLQTSKVRQQLAGIREEEAKLRSKFNLLEQENARLEKELLETSDKYLEALKLNEICQKELSVMPELKERLADLESHMGDLQEQSHQSLMQEIEKHKRNNQELKDKIDELTLEIESLHQNCAAESSASKEINRTHSWLSDYKKLFEVGNKRRNSDSSTEDNSDEESPTSEKVRKKLSLNESETHVLAPTSFDNTEKSQSPTAMDLFLRDLMMDQSQLMRRLQISEENRIRMERENHKYKNKNSMLMSMLYNMMPIAEKQELVT